MPSRTASSPRPQRTPSSRTKKTPKRLGIGDGWGSDQIAARDWTGKGAPLVDQRSALEAPQPLLQPWQVATPLILLFTFTTQLYFFATPSSLKPGTSRQLQTGRWGPINSDFDWCERNYEVLEMVAEPLNSATSGLYPLIALYGFSWSSPRPSFWHLVLLVVTAAMGVGSVIFHGSLRYDTQLLDELPLHALAVIAAAVLLRRNAKQPDSSWLQPFSALWSALLAIVILSTPREGAVHQAFRGFMTCSFCVGFVVVLASGTSAAAEADTWGASASSSTTSTAGSAATPAAAHDGSRLFVRCFLSFVVGIVSWVVDIMMCETIRQMPLIGHRIAGVFHACGWHGGTALGLYYVYCLLILHERRRDHGGMAARVDWSGMLPIIVAAADGRKARVP